MSGVKIRCGRRIHKIDVLRCGVDLIAHEADKMIVAVTQDAIERIRKDAPKFTRQRDGAPFRDDEIVVEVAFAIIPIGELAHLESREWEYERERQRVRDLTTKLNIAEARRRAARKMRRR